MAENDDLPTDDEIDDRVFASLQRLAGGTRKMDFTQWITSILPKAATPSETSTNSSGREPLTAMMLEKLLSMIPAPEWSTQHPQSEKPDGQKESLEAPAPPIISEESPAEIAPNPIRQLRQKRWL